MPSEVGFSNQWSINPESLRVCRNEDGSPVKLGSGGHGSVSPALHSS